MNPVIRFEMPAEDRKRAAAFYAAVFGWQMKEFGPEMGNFILATTTESDEQNTPKNPGAINGGFFTKTEQNGTPKIMVQVDDIHEAIKKIEAAGGKVISGRTPDGIEDMPGLGKFANIQDTEGNQVALMQPK